MKRLPPLIIVVLFAASASAQMMGGSQPGSGVNMMSMEVLAANAGRGPGVGGSFWKTDLWIKSAAGSKVTLEFHVADSVTDAPAAAAIVNVDHGIAYLPDVLKSAFNIDQGFGNIVLRSTTSAVSAQLRVYTAGGGGSYGAGYLAMPTSTAMRGSGGMMDGDDQYQLYVLGLQPQPKARVNVTVSNAGVAPITGTVEILDADGQAPSGATVSLPFSIRAYSSHQFGNVLDGLRSRYGEDTTMQIRVRLADGSSGMVMVFASVVDNITNDTYIVSGSMMDGLRGMMP